MISLNKKFKELISKDNEYTNIVFRHFSNIKCECLTQPKLIFDESSKAMVPNKYYRAVANPECPNCEGAGWVFDEFMIRCMYFYPGFRFSHFDDYQYATTGENTLTVFMKVDENWDRLKPNDVFFNVRADKKGKMLSPIVKYRKWIVNDVFEMRLDSNKIEFMKIYAKPAVI